MSTAQIRLKLLLIAVLSVLASQSGMAQTSDSPSDVTTRYLDSVQRIAKLWVDTHPWPSRYQEFLEMSKAEFSPLLSSAALMELEAKPVSGPKELSTSSSEESDDDDVYEGMIACVAQAHFTVLSETIEGDRATVEVETTVANPFGSGKTESFQDRLVLVRENGRWVLTPEAFKTFAF